MMLILSILMVCIVYVVSFKEDYKAAELDKVSGVLLVIGLATVMLGTVFSLLGAL